MTYNVSALVSVLDRHLHPTGLQFCPRQQTSERKEGSEATGNWYKKAYTALNWQGHGAQTMGETLCKAVFIV